MPSAVTTPTVATPHDLESAGTARPTLQSRAAGLLDNEALVLATVGCTSLVLALAAFGILPQRPVLAVVMLPILAAVGAITLLRFEWLVLGLLLSRATLDYFSTVDGSGPPVSAAIGGFFVATAALWLLLQYLSGTAAPMSAGVRALTVLGGVVLLSVASSEKLGASLGTGIRVVAGILMFLVIEQLLARGQITRQQLVLVVACSAALPVLYGLVQILGPTPIDPITGLPRISSTFVHPNALATYLVGVIVLCLGSLLGMSRRLQIPILILSAAAGFVVIYTYTRIAYLALLGGIAYLGIRRSKVLLGVLATAVVLALVLVPSILARFSDLSAEPVNDKTPANSIEWRLLYWQELAPMLTESPVTGIGIGMVRLGDGRVYAPHNVWLQLGLETGILGVAAGLGTVATIGRDLWRRERQASGRLAASHAAAATAVALAFLSQTGSENLLDSTLLWWYLAAALALGASATPRPDTESGT